MRQLQNTPPVCGANPCTTIPISDSELCGVGSGCEGFGLGGDIQICREAEQTKITGILTLSMPDGLDWDEWQGVAVGWGMETLNNNKSEFYLAMNSEQAGQMVWSSMSGTTGQALDYVSQSPRKAFLSGNIDSPVTWNSEGSTSELNEYTVSASRYFYHQDASRLLSEGESRAFSACFFTLTGTEACTEPVPLDLTNNCDSPAVGGTEEVGSVDTPLMESVEVQLQDQEFFDENVLDQVNVPTQDAELAQAVDELKELNDNGNRVAGDENVSELIIEVGELDKFSEQESDAVKQAREAYEQALKDYQDLKAKQDWSDLIRLPRTEFYKDTPAIEDLRNQLAAAEAKAQGAQDALQGKINAWKEGDVFDVNVEEPYLLDMQKAYDDWLRAKANYGKTIDDAVNGIKERDIPNDFNADDKQHLQGCQDEEKNARDAEDEGAKDLAEINQADQDAEQDFNDKEAILLAAESDAKDADQRAKQLEDQYKQQHDAILADYENKLKNLNGGLGQNRDLARNQAQSAQNALQDAQGARDAAQAKRDDLKDKVAAVKSYANLLTQRHDQTEDKLKKCEANLDLRLEQRKLREKERVRLLRIATRQSLSVELKMKIHMLKLRYEKAQQVILERRNQLVNAQKKVAERQYQDELVDFENDVTNADDEVLQLKAELAASIQAAQDSHYFARFNQKKQELIDAAREKFERQQAIFKSQLKIQQEYINHKNMLERLRQAQKTLEAQQRARETIWDSQKKVLEQRRQAELAAAAQFEAQEQARKAQAARERAALEKALKERARKEALQAKLARQSAGSGAGSLVSTGGDAATIDVGDVDLAAVDTNLSAEERARLDAIGLVPAAAVADDASADSGVSQDQIDEARRRAQAALSGAGLN